MIILNISRLFMEKLIRQGRLDLKSFSIAIKKYHFITNLIKAFGGKV